MSNVRLNALSKSALAFILLLCSAGLARSQNDPSYIMPTDVSVDARQDVGGGFWRTDGNFDSILRIKNILETSSVSVSPVLWMSDGSEYDLKPVLLSAGENISIDIRQALQVAPHEVQSHLSQFGSASIRYSWKWDDAVVAHITSIDEVASLTQTSHLVAPVGGNLKAFVKPAINVSEALWWLQTEDASPFLTLVNTGRSPLVARVTMSDEKNVRETWKEVKLESNASLLVELDDLVRDLPASRAGGLRVAYQGVPGTLVAEAGVQDPKAGYSVPLSLTSAEVRRLKLMRSPTATTLVAIGVQLGKPDPKMQFPSDTNFVPYAILRNMSARPLLVEVGVTIMNPGVESVSLASVSVEKGQTMSLDLEKWLQRSRLANYSGEATLRFNFQGSGDEVIASTGSTAQFGNYVFNVEPVLAVPDPGQYICEWESFGKTDTMFSFWNSGDAAEDATLVLSHYAGKYSYRLHLEAKASATLDLGSLIRAGVPDRDGRVIPMNATTGSAHFMEAHQNRSLTSIKVHTAIFNVEAATCREPCPICDGITSATMTPVAGVLGVGDQMQYQVIATAKDGSTTDVTSRSAWSTSNGTIAAVSGRGVVSAVAIGSANISAQYVDTGNPSWNPNSLCSYPSPSCPRFVAAPVEPVRSGIKLTRTLTDCSQTAKTGQIIGGWGQNGLSGCLLTASVPPVPLPTGGSCGPDGNGVEVYTFTKSNGQIVYAYPLNARVADSACMHFIDNQSGVVTVSIAP